MRIIMRFVSLAFWGIIVLSSTGMAFGQNFPTKPMRIIVPYTPGGTTDNLARICGQKLTEAWGQPVIVDNRPGAGGIVGAELAARSAPDGHTLFLGTSASLATNVSLHKKLPYDPVKDFAPAALLAKGFNVLVVNPSVPAKNVKELIDLAKAKPGQLNFASSGNGSSQHLSGEYFKSMAGVDIVHVAYKGSAAALVDLRGGQVQMMFENIPTAMPHFKAGALRALAVTGAKRWPSLPEIPTIAESGLPGYELGGFYGLVAPAATPKPIIAKLNSELNRIIMNPELRDWMLNQGFEPSPMTPDEFSALIKNYIIKNAKIVKESGAKVE
jgi:tripartite-type tricarboxylate transporter receptor subunit TctC